jgi:hypothetical protein
MDRIEEGSTLLAAPGQGVHVNVANNEGVPKARP